MHLTESRLRKLVESILAEGFKDDSEFLSVKYDYPVESLTPKHVQWLMPRFGDNASISPGHSFSDVIETLNTFIKESGALSSKYRDSETFRSAIDSTFPDRKWNSPADILNISSDDMVKILDMSKKKKQRFEITDMGLPESDRIGKIGEWNIWLPSSRENSCKIAGFDPITMAPKTQWCTARTGGSNLFYSYVAGGVFLFYVIKDNPAKANDWTSLGYKNKKLSLQSSHGGFSVNRDNVGLTESLCIKIFGNETFEAIKELTKNYIDDSSNKSPAFSKIEDGAQNVEALENLIKGISKDEASNIKQSISKIKTISTDVLMKLADDENREVRAGVAQNPKASDDVLMKLAVDEDRVVRAGVAQNPKASVDVLMKLAVDEDKNVRSHIARNPKSPVDVLIELAVDENSYVRHVITQNPNVPVDVLMKLAVDEDRSVRYAITQNPKTPDDVLRRVAGDKDSYVRAGVAQNTKVSVDVLIILAGDEDKSVRFFAAKNSKTPVAVLMKLAGDEDSYVRSGVAKNPKTPDDVLMKLADDKDSYVRSAVPERLKSKNNLSENLIHLIRALIIN